MNCARGEKKMEILKIALTPWIKSFFKKHFPFEMNITHQCMHFMSPLPHLVHKGHTPYLFQADKTHIQFPRSLWPACSVQQNNGCPWKMVDDNRQSKPRYESFAGSERTACLHTSVTTQLHRSLCSCSSSGLPVC